MLCTNDAIQAYTETHTQEESPLLAQIVHETTASVPLPHMLAGHLQGRVLAMIAHMLQPSTILEIGTYTGYSAICLAEGMRTGGVLYTIDHNEALAPIAKRNFAEAKLPVTFKHCIGKAIEIIPTIEDTFDLVYIDADKRNYRAYYDMVLKKIRSGGIIIADNVLWGGKVLPDVVELGDKRAKALADFNRYVHEDSRVANVLLPIRDGLMILRKL